MLRSVFLNSIHYLGDKNNMKGTDNYADHFCIPDLHITGCNINPVM